MRCLSIVKILLHSIFIFLFSGVNAFITGCNTSFVVMKTFLVFVEIVLKCRKKERLQFFFAQAMLFWNKSHSPSAAQNLGVRNRNPGLTSNCPLILFLRLICLLVMYSRSRNSPRHRLACEKLIPDSSASSSSVFGRAHWAPREQIAPSC